MQSAYVELELTWYHCHPREKKVTQGTRAAAVSGRKSSQMFNMSVNRRHMADLETGTVCTLHATVKIILMDMANRLSLHGELGDTRENICQVQHIISAMIFKERASMF